MPLAEFIVVARLIAEATVCEERRYGFPNEGEVRGCVNRAQPFLADLRRARPGWIVKDWRCAVVDGSEREA